MRLFGGSGRRLPDLVTVLVEQRRDGTFAAEFIGEGSLPADSGGYADMDALVSEVDRDALALYCSSPSEPTAAIGFQYAWYPWGDDQKALKLPGGPKDYMLFEIRQSGGGYEASLSADPAITAAAPHLAELPQGIASKVFERWPALVGRTVPGMLHWNRELTAVGFREATIRGSA